MQNQNIVGEIIMRLCRGVLLLQQRKSGKLQTKEMFQFKITEIRCISSGYSLCLFPKLRWKDAKVGHLLKIFI